LTWVAPEAQPRFRSPSVTPVQLISPRRGLGRAPNGGRDERRRSGPRAEASRSRLRSGGRPSGGSSLRPRRIAYRRRRRTALPPTERTHTSG
jgi:hypothetical protein